MASRENGRYSSGLRQKEVYDYRTDKYVSQYSMDEDSLAEFEIVYTDRQGNKLKADDLNARLIYERRDYYWRWSDSEGWSSGYDQKDLVMSDDKISIAKDGTAKVTVPVSWGHTVWKWWIRLPG